MKFIILFLFISPNGYEHLNKMDGVEFKTEKDCKKYLKENMVQRKDLKFYCHSKSK